MTEQAAPAPATDTPSHEPLSISQAVALMDRQDATAKAAPAPAQPEQKAEPAASTDTVDETPVEEAGEVEQEEGEQPETEAEAEPTDDGETIIALPDGKEVPLAELVKGYQRQADYTRKTQAVAEDRKALEQSRQQVADTAKQIEEQWTARVAQLEADQKTVAKLRDDYSKQVETLSAALNKRDAEWGQVNWQAMQQKIATARASGDAIAAAEASAEYMDLRAQYDMHQQAKRAVADEQAKTQTERDAEEAQRKDRETTTQKAAREAAEAKVKAHAVSKYPDFQDPAKGPKLVDAMFKTAHSLGFTKQEVESTLDPRNFDLWMKATLYDQLTGKAAGVTQQTEQNPKTPPSVRIVKGNAPRPRPSTVERGRLGGIANAFEQSRTFEDALRFENAKTEYARSRTR